MVSTPQVASENNMENTATTTIRRCASAHEGHRTLPLSSSNDSFMYVTIKVYFTLYIAREERLELPTPGFGDQCSTN